MTNISYFIKDTGGCAYYRAMMPLDMLHEQKLASVMRIEKGEDLNRIEAAFEGADAVLFPRITAGKQMLAIVEELKKNGKLTVADYDDNIFKVNPLSNHYADYGLVEYQHVTRDENGQKKRIDVWKDGVGNFSIKRNRERLEAVKRSLQAVDLVTTTTEVLADVLRAYAKNVVVLPNCVDFKRWQSLPLKPHDEIRMFWAGGSSHFEDLNIIGPVLPVVMERFPRLHLIVMWGAPFMSIIKDLPQDRVEIVPWEDNLSYPYKCAQMDADIALIPLVDNPFNRCKSALKWVEQSALGVPSVMSGVTPYIEMYNGENAVVVGDNSAEAWIEAISTLVREPMLRAKIGGEAQRYVKARYDIRDRAVDWLKAYEHAFEAQPKAMEAACQ